MFPVKMTAKKYFIAIVVPNPLYAQVETIKHELLAEHNLRGALRSPAHITLHRPFEWKEEKEALLIERLSQFTFAENFAIELNGFAFFEPRVVYVNVLKNDLLESLHDKLKRFAQKELKLTNEVNDLRGFHPHITVAFRDLKKPKFYELRDGFEKRQFSGTFIFNGFSLLKLDKKWEPIRDFSLK